MNPNRLNAAQLLMNFSAHENGKLCQRIYDSEFSQELQSMTRATQQGEGMTPVSTISPLPHSAAPSFMGNLAPAEQPLPPPTVAQMPQGEPSSLLNASANESVQSQAAKPNVNRPTTSAKKPVLARKPQSAEQPAFTNPLVLDRILAQLQLPSEARQRCAETLNTEGHLSVNTFFSVLAGSAPGSRTQNSPPPAVPASDVQELIKSIKMGSSSDRTGLNDLKLKESGAYTLEEIRDLIRPLTQNGHRRTAPQGRPQVRDSAAASPGSTGELALESQAGAVPEGHVEQLSKSRIPTFSEVAPARPSGTRRSPAEDEQDSVRSPAAGDRLRAPYNGPDEIDLSAPSIPVDPEIKEAFERTSRTHSEPSSAARSHGRPEAPERHQDLSPQPPNPRSVAEQAGGASNGTERAAHSSFGLHPASPREQIPAVMAVSLTVGEEQTAEVPEGLEGLEGLDETSADFQIEPLASGDNPFEGLDRDGAGNSSPNRRDHGNPSDAFQANRDADASAGFKRSENETGFSIPGSSSVSAGRTRTEERAERVNIHQPDWPRRVSEQVMDRARTGKSSLVVELEPQDLGHMTLRIEADQRHVTAWVSTQNEEARNLLLQNASALQKHLAEHGLSLGEFNVNVSDGRGNARENAGNREARRTSRVSGRRDGELQSQAVAPGVHGRIMGQGSNQMISLIA